MDSKGSSEINSEGDLGYTQENKIPFTGKLEEYDDIPYSFFKEISLVGETKTDREAVLMSSLSSLRQKIEGQNVKCLYASYYDQMPSPNSNNLLSSGITTLWENENNEELIIYSQFGRFFLKGIISPSRSGSLIDFGINDGNSTYLGFKDFPFRSGTGLQKILKEWASAQKENNYKKVDEMYEKLLNPYIFRKPMSRKEWGNPPFGRNPLLYFTWACYRRYFDSPSVAEKHLRSQRR